VWAYSMFRKKRCSWHVCPSSVIASTYVQIFSIEVTHTLVLWFSSSSSVFFFFHFFLIYGKVERLLNCSISKAFFYTWISISGFEFYKISKWKIQILIIEYLLGEQLTISVFDPHCEQDFVWSKLIRNDFKIKLHGSD
jgi:hypothetical protein